MTKCRSCGAEAPANASICPECGHKLMRRGLAWLRCSNCGSLVHASQTICAACGQPVSWPSLRAWLYAGLAIVAVSALLYGTRGTLGRMVSRHLAALPTALYEAASVELATVTVAPVAPTATLRPWLAEVPTLPPTTEPTPTATYPPVPTASSTPSPTMTATLTETPTSADTPEPTETATPALKYPAPVLLEPSNGLQYSGRGGQILLRWEPVGALAPDEFYGVSLRYVSNGGVAYAGTWTQDTSWRVPRELWQKYDQGHPQYEWDVVVMRQTGTDASGGRTGEAISPKSETRVFIWE